MDNGTDHTEHEYIAYQKNKETTDMSIDARLYTDNYAETKEWGITAPYITMQLARVTRRDFDGEINVVATVDQTASNSIADAMAPGAEKLMCSKPPFFRLSIVIFFQACIDTHLCVIRPVIHILIMKMVR